MTKQIAAEQSTSRTEVTFSSQGVECAAWHYAAASPALTDASGRPCVVMAHGFGGTRDTGLAGFAEAFAAAGIDTVVFDYRAFGASQGEPRQVIDIKAQLADYAAALRFARSLDGIDPDRVAVWGVSLSGGHVFRIAATDRRVAAAVALTPSTDGRASALAALRRTGLMRSLRGVPAALTTRLRSGGGPVYTPVTGRPGENAAVTAPGSYEAYTALGGPTWQNRYTMTDPLSMLNYRPGLDAPRISCPVLVQIGDLDQSAPPLPAGEAARRLRAAEVRHYPCDHFDVYTGAEWHAHVVAHEVDFLARHLAAREDLP